MFERQVSYASNQNIDKRVAYGTLILGLELRSPVAQLRYEHQGTYQGLCTTAQTPDIALHRVLVGHHSRHH